MPFSAYDLRYRLEESYPALCNYLQHRAQRYLGQLAFDAFEMDQVVGHVIEYLTRIQLLGGGSHAPQTALDGLSNAQFYTFLNRMVQNKAIDRLRRRRLPMTTTGEPNAYSCGAIRRPLSTSIRLIVNQSVLEMVEHSMRRGLA